MASIGSVTLIWGDEEHTFDLQPNRWMRELQTKTNMGPFELLKRLRAGTWLIDDVRHVIRIGLLGGGKTDIEANKLMAVQFDNRPIMDNLPVAITILAAGLFGGAEPTKKAEAEAAEPEKTEKSPSPNSTAPEQS